MKFNLKLLIIAFVLNAGFAYAAEQKEDFDNKDFQRFFEEKSREYRATAFMRRCPSAIQENLILSMKPNWYKEWKSQITTNPDESLSYLLDHSHYNYYVLKPEFDQKIEELIKNKTDINNNKCTNGQTLMMKILEKISKTIEYASDRFDKIRGAPILIESYLEVENEEQKLISKLIDVLKKVLPNVNDFYVKDDSGKTVFDYAKGNDEVTELLKSALKERKKKIGELLDIKTPLIPDLQDIVCDY